MKDTVAARKYAVALFSQSQALKQVLASQQGLEEMVRTKKFYESLRLVLSHPFIAISEKQKLLKTALGEYATPLLETFLNLLVLRRRFDLLPLIVQEFIELVDRSNNTLALKVRSAFSLTETQKRTLQQKLEKWLQSKVRMETQVDPDLIGGVTIQTRDLECDPSLKGQLNRIKSLLAV